MNAKPRRRKALTTVVTSAPGGVIAFPGRSRIGVIGVGVPSRNPLAVTRMARGVKEEDGGKRRPGKRGLRGFRIAAEQGLVSPYRAAEAFFTFPWTLIIDGLRRATRPRSDRFGLREALLWPHAIDRLTRYGLALGYIDGPGDVLEVGAGEEGPPSGRQAFPANSGRRIVLVDVRTPEVGTAWQTLQASVVSLPFRSDSFPFVLCLDTLEHIPADRRGQAIEELKRVTSDRLVLHFPCDSGDGGFAGSDANLAFQDAHVRTLRVSEPNTEEHLSLGLPRLEEVLAHLPGATAAGSQNATVWLRKMLWGRLPFLRHLAGCLYLVRGRKAERDPPFYGALVVWEKRGSEGIGHVRGTTTT